ncbi:MAG: DegV family protein [Lachnospiraceae bacterium]|nr:DegV family protein [Lachnospiraceae bacterium]
MADFMITTDTTADLPADYVAEHHLGIMSLTYTLEGVTYDWEHPMDVKEFYQKMRDGSMPTTSQVNPEIARELFTKWATEGNCDILHVAFSSGLSGSYNSARMAAQELEEEGFPHKILVIDSLCASLGEGLLIHKALQKKEAGASLEETAQFVEDIKLHIVHNFTVDNLFHLYRGGRVSKTAAFLGTIASIKPILHVDNDGHLIPLSKVRGRKKSLLALVDSMEQQMGSYADKNDIVFISHGDSVEDAQFVADQIKLRFGIDSFLINYVGSTIGAHSGPGTIALFYLGDYR